MRQGDNPIDDKNLYLDNQDYGRSFIRDDASEVFQYTAVHFRFHQSGIQHLRIAWIDGPGLCVRLLCQRVFRNCGHDVT